MVGCMSVWLWAHVSVSVSVCVCVWQWTYNVMQDNNESFPLTLTDAVQSLPLHFVLVHQRHRLAVQTQNRVDQNHTDHSTGSSLLPTPEGLTDTAQTTSPANTNKTVTISFNYLKVKPRSFTNVKSKSRICSQTKTHFLLVSEWSPIH